MANTSIILTNLDFDTQKNTLKAYLKSQDQFKDYDFDGSNMSVLLDILSYNTYHNSFYLNMIGNEMFFDTAQLRDSVVSHAKELNYTPRSFTSAIATVSMTFVSTDLTKRSVVIPKGTSFTSRFGAKIYTFTVAENVVVNSFVINSNNTITFTAPEINLYEGYFVTDTFTYNVSNPQRFLISNKNVDISSIGISVIEDAGGTTLNYTRAQSLFDIDSTSKVFFVQGAENDSYEVVFGDNVSGRAPKDNSVITIEYRISNGELPNGCSTFTPDTNIDGITYENITVTTLASATGGSVSESIDSIKYNAPRHFTTQERAITTEDYENLLKINFPEINTVTVFGGEDLDPPQFGKVFVSVDLKDLDGLPPIKRDQYYKFLKPRSPVSIDPVFVDPAYTYIGVTCNVKYNVNVTRLTSQDIATIASSAIVNYSLANLNNFNRTFRFSRLSNAIDSSQISIISNETSIKLIKLARPTKNVASNIDLAFEIPLDTTRAFSAGGYAIKSAIFTYNNQKATLRDDGAGRIQIISQANDQIIQDGIGTVNYETGLVQLTNFTANDYDAGGIKVYATPRNKDISITNNVILNILEEDIDMTVTAIRG